MSRVAVVTDSTACLTPDLLSQSGVRVVPVQVIVDGAVLLDGVDIHSHGIAEALHSAKHITTSRPAPQEFLEAYEQAADSGVDSILSVHLSQALSGTLDSARLAARDASVPVNVVDSRTIGMGLGFAALNAAHAAAEGGDLDRVAGVAESTAAGSHVIFYVDTLEFLRKGGRIGKASALLGSALRVKPLLHVLDGEVAPLEKARTSAKALGRLLDIATEYARTPPVQVAVQHLDALERADSLAGQLHERLGVDVVVCEISAVMGVHVGPGTVSVAVAPA